MHISVIRLPLSLRPLGCCYDEDAESFLHHIASASDEGLRIIKQQRPLHGMPPTTNFASALTAVSRTLHRWARFTPPKGCIRTAPTTRTLDVARPFTWNSPHSRSRQSSTFSFAEGRRQSQHRSHASAGTTGSVVALASMTGLATYLYTTDDPRFNLYGTPRHRFNGVRTPRYGNARDLKHVCRFPITSSMEEN